MFSLLTNINNPRKLVSLFMMSPFKKYLSEGITYAKLRNLALIFILAFLLQIKYSKQARSWTKSMGNVMLYVLTTLGICGSVATLLLKYKIDKSS